MKRTILLLLVLSIMVVSGCGETATTEEAIQPAEVSQDEALDEIEGSLISEEDEVEIGEMI